MTLDEYRKLSRFAHPDTMQLMRVHLFDPLRKAENADQALKLLLELHAPGQMLNSMVVSHSGTCYRFRGYEIRLFYSNEVASRLVEALRRVEGLNLLCAPDLVEFIQFPEFGSVVVTYFRGLDYTGKLVALRLVSPKPNQSKLTHQARDVFRRDMDTLAEQGLMIPEALKDTDLWSLHPHTEHIVLQTMAWAAMSAIDPADVTGVGAAIDYLLEIEARAA